MEAIDFDHSNSSLTTQFKFDQFLFNNGSLVNFLEKLSTYLLETPNRGQENSASALISTESPCFNEGPN